MPLAIVIGMSMIAIFYVTINISYFTVLTITQIQSSDAVAVSLAQAKLGKEYKKTCHENGQFGVFCVIFSNF